MRPIAFASPSRPARNRRSEGREQPKPGMRRRSPRKTRAPFACPSARTAVLPPRELAAPSSWPIADSSRGQRRGHPPPSRQSRQNLWAPNPAALPKPLNAASAKARPPRLQPPRLAFDGIGRDKPPIRVGGAQIPLEGPHISDAPDRFDIALDDIAHPVAHGRYQLAHKPDRDMRHLPGQAGVRHIGGQDAHEAEFRRFVPGFRARR